MADPIIGTDDADHLVGTSDADVISGLHGPDTIEGLDGNDTIDGGGGADRLFGGAGNDTLKGGEGVYSDLLDGGAGADAMAGGRGNDSYVVDDPGDTITEYLDGGVDTITLALPGVPSPITTYTMPDNVENLGFTVNRALVVLGNSGANTIIATAQAGYATTMRGMAGDDTLTGGNEPDTLDGGSGADLMTGSGGNDTYVVDQTGDRVVEAAGGGTDTVRSYISYVLGDNVENLTLLGLRYSQGTGNALDNRIVGNAGNNLLIGLDGNDTLIGGGGTDRLLGGRGDDSYTVDSADDTVTEYYDRGLGGYDTINSSIDLTLPDNVEALTLTGSADLAGNGNGLDNTLTGNGGANRLYGGAGDDQLFGKAGGDSLYGGVGNDYLDGGTGADLMTGGKGDDIYIVDDAADRIVEWNDGGKGGTDTAFVSLLDYTLPDNVENLVLNRGYTGRPEAHGNSLDNFILGDSGPDYLYGEGGDDTINGFKGLDRLIGGAGADTFSFYAGQVDGKRILDFTAEDRLSFDGIPASANAYVEITGPDRLVFHDGGRAETLYLDTTHLTQSQITIRPDHGYVEIYNGNDLHDGTAGNDTLNGGDATSDHMYGEDGDDKLFGYAGVDLLYGGNGDDLLDGGRGTDLLSGGAGADRFAFRRGQANGDRITDFTSADRLVLVGYGDGAFVTKGSGSIDIHYYGGTETVFLDTAAFAQSQVIFRPAGYTF